MIEPGGRRHDLLLAPGMSPLHGRRVLTRHAQQPAGAGACQEAADMAGVGDAGVHKAVEDRQHDRGDDQLATFQSLFRANRRDNDRAGQAHDAARGAQRHDVLIDQRGGDVAADDRRQEYGCGPL